MTTIILSASQAAHDRAVAAGFEVVQVLVRHDGPAIGDQERAKLKSKLECELMTEVRPNQFLVGEYWGAGPR